MKGSLGSYKFLKNLKKNFFWL